VKDASNVVIADKLYLYDGANAHTAQPNHGRLTATRTWVKGALSTGDYSQITYGYDAWGNQSTVTTYTGYGTASSAPTVGAQTTTTTYDDDYHAYPLTITNAKGHVTQFAYNYAKGVPTSLTDPNGNTTTAGYDDFGRVTSITRAGDASATLTMTYADGNPFTTTVKLNALNYTVTRKYDGMGRSTETNAGGVITKTEYTSPTVTKQSLPYTSGETIYWTTTTISPTNRTTTVTAPDGTSTMTTVNGLTTTVKDAKNNETVSVSDVWGRVVNVIPPMGPKVWYDYDEMGNLRFVTRGTEKDAPLATVTEIFYDEGGRKTSMTDPDMGYWTYEYDALGNLTTQTDARSCILTMNYDDLNRLMTKTSSGAGCGTQVNMSYTYDVGANGIGRRTSMNDASGSTAWEYDIRGRVTKETKSITGHSAFVTEYGYNTADLMTWMKYPDNEIVNYTYNSRMMLQSASSLMGTYASSIQYDSAGRMTNLTRGTGTLNTTYVYFPWTQNGGRLKNLTTTRQGLEIQELDYTYDANGNILTIFDSLTSDSQAFAYDSLDRLISASATGGLADYSEPYTYNTTTGNLETKGTLNLSYPAEPTMNCVNNRALPAHGVASAGGNNYEYDCNGNMVTREIDSGALAGDYELVYDAENRLVKVKKGTTTIAEFVYDADGRRVKSIMDGETRLFAGDHYEVVVNGTETKYYFAGTSMIALRKDGVLNFVLGDHLGSTSLTTDADGVVISELLYTAWGEVRHESGITATNHTYTGQYSNVNDFGLMYYRARWMDPQLGRFSQPDTIIPSNQGVQAWDRYGYVNNNPVRYTDPTGHSCVPCLVAVLVIGAIILSGDTDPNVIQEPPSEMPFGDFIPDGRFTSINISIAGKSKFWTGGVDIINTKRQAGVFLTSSVNDPTSCNCSTLNKKTPFMMPNVSISVNKGVLLGDELKRDIEAYSGGASVISAGKGLWSGEAFSSVDETGKRTNKITGVGAGFGLGVCLFDLCGSSYYTNSEVAKLAGKKLILDKFWVE
jgi:RHS repeat-associated protein